MSDAIARQITVQPVTPAEPLVVCSSRFLHTLAYVEREVAHLSITEPGGAQVAATYLQRLTRAGADLERVRTELKAPFIAKGKEIDDAARAPAARFKAAKTVLKQKVTAWQAEEQRKAREAEAARQAELRRLEAQRFKEEREAREKSDRLAREAEEAAAKLRASAAPTVEVDFGDDVELPPEPPPKTATEIAIEQVRYAPPIVAAKPSGLAFRTTLKIASIDITKLPEVFVIRTANERAIRATFCQAYRDGDPLPECSGVSFEVERTPVSTGRQTF